MQQHSPPNVGEFIQKVYLEPNGARLSQNDLADQLGASEHSFNNLVAGNTELTDEMALGLSKVLGGSRESWLNIQSNYKPLEPTRIKPFMAEG